MTPDPLPHQGGAPEKGRTAPKTAPSILDLQAELLAAPAPCIGRTSGQVGAR